MKYLCLGGDNLAFTDTLALSSHGEGFLQFLAEDDVLDQHALNGDTPSGSDILDDLSDRLSDLLTTLDDILQDSSTNNMAQSSLGTLHKSLSDVVDAKSSLVRRDDMVVDDGRESQGDVVLGHAHLLGNLGGLDLDINLDETLAERIDIDQTGVDSLVELAELGDETNITLLDVLVWVGADDAAGNGTHASNESTEGIDYW